MMPSLELLVLLATAIHQQIISLHQRLLMVAQREERIRAGRVALLRRSQRRTEMSKRLVLHSGPLGFGIPIATSKTPMLYRRYWIYPRNTDWWENFLMHVGGDKEWLQHFHMTRSTFEFLAEELAPFLQRQSTQMRQPITVHKRLAICIWWLVTNCCYRILGQQFGIGRSTAALIVHEVCLAIECHLLKDAVSFGNMQMLMDSFARLGFPYCIGAVDGTQIPILTPGRQATKYINQKNFFSVLLMGTVDGNGRFVNLDIVWTDRVHDSFIFKNTALCEAMDAGAIFPGNPLWTIQGVQVPPLIIGDAAFPMRKWLMKPYGGHLDPIKAEFNSTLAKVHNVVECAFKRLRQRWGCLHGTLHIAEENVNSVIAACVVLHNMCEAREPEMFSGDMEESVRLPENTWLETEMERRTEAEGKEVQDAVAQFLWENSRKESLL